MNCLIVDLDFRFKHSTHSIKTTLCKWNTWLPTLIFDANILHTESTQHYRNEMFELRPWFRYNHSTHTINTTLHTWNVWFSTLIFDTNILHTHNQHNMINMKCRIFDLDCQPWFSTLMFRVASMDQCSNTMQSKQENAHSASSSSSVWLYECWLCIIRLLTLECMAICLGKS